MASLSDLDTIDGSGAGPPPAAPAPAGAPATPATPAAPDGSWENSPLAAKLQAAEQPTISAQSAPPTQPDRGYVANIGAGTSEAVSGMLGFPVDVTTAGLNLAARGLGLPQIQDPVGGHHWWNQIFGTFRANPEEVIPATTGEEYARAGSRGLTSVLLPGGIARRLVSAGATAPALETLAAGATPVGAAAGAVGGVTGQAAADQVPPEWQPLADMLGNIAGGGSVAGGAAATQGLGRVGAAMAARMTRPLNPVWPFRGAMPTETPVSPVTGQPFVDPATGQPLTARPSQMALAGQRIATAAGMPPGELATAIPQPTPEIPGQATMGQTMGNQGLLNLERTLRFANRGPFTAQEAQNNAARISALAGLSGPEAARPAAAEFFLNRLNEINAVPETEQQLRDWVRSYGEGLPTTTPATAGEQMAQRIAAAQAPRIGQSEAALGAATQTAQTAREGIGPATPAELAPQGRAMQTGLAQLQQAKDQQISRLADAIDPNGTAVANMQPVIDAAGMVRREAEARPNMRAADGETADILGLAAGHEPAAPFRDLRDLRTRITNELRVVNADPSLAHNKFALRSLLNGVDEAMATTAGEQAAQDATAGVAPHQAAGTRMAAASAPGEPATAAQRPRIRTVQQIMAENGVPAARAKAIQDSEIMALAHGAPPPPTLTPNISPENVAAYQTMRAARLAAAKTYEEGAVGEVLAPGARKGEFAMQAERVMPRLFHPGGASAEEAQAMLNALGGRTDAEAAAAFRQMAPDPNQSAALMTARHDALAAAQRYAGFSLRQAAEKDGVFNPVAARQWMRQHDAALNAIPGMKDRFGSVVDLHQRLADLQAERAAIDKEYQPMLNAKTSADLAARYVQGGRNGAEAVRAYRRATAGDPTADQDLHDLALSTLRSRAFRNGEWSTPAYEGWMREHESMLSEMPQLRASLQDVGSAQRSLTASAARRQADIKTYTDSAARHYLSKTGEPVDPQSAINSLMQSNTAPADMRSLMRMTARDPAAREGIVRNFTDWLTGKLTTTTEAGVSGLAQLSKAQLSRMLKEGKIGRTIDEVYTPEQRQILENTLESMALEARFRTAATVPGSSSTAAEAHALEGETHTPSLLTQALLGEFAGEGLGALTGMGGVHGFLLRGAGIAGSVLLSAARKAGFQRIRDLATQGLLQPELGRLLAQRAVIEPKSPILGRLQQRILALAAVSAPRGLAGAH